MPSKFRAWFIYHWWRIEALDEIINQSLQCITRDSTKECVSTETQTGGVSSTEYVDSGVETNDDLFVMVANKVTHTDSDCHTPRNYLFVKGWS